MKHQAKMEAKELRREIAAKPQKTGFYAKVVLKDGRLN